MVILCHRIVSVMARRNAIGSFREKCFYTIIRLGRIKKKFNIGFAIRLISRRNNQNNEFIWIVRKASHSFYTTIFRSKICVCLSYYSHTTNRCASYDHRLMYNRRQSHSECESKRTPIVRSRCVFSDYYIFETATAAGKTRPKLLKVTFFVLTKSLLTPINVYLLARIIYIYIYT